MQREKLLSVCHDAKELFCAENGASEDYLNPVKADPDFMKYFWPKK
jgi:hypothetical protein